MLNDSLLIGSSIYLDGTLSFYNYRETRDEGLYNRVFNGYLGNIGYSTVDPAHFPFPNPGNNDSWNGFNGEAYGSPGLGMMYLPQSKNQVSMIKMDSEYGLYLMTKARSQNNYTGEFFIQIDTDGITMGFNGIPYFEINS